jgi:hypothetical protein
MTTIDNWTPFSNAARAYHPTELGRSRPGRARSIVMNAAAAAKMIRN